LDFNDNNNPLALLAEALPQLVWSCAPDGNLDYVNRRWQDVTGLSAGRPMDEVWREVVHPDDAAEFQAQWQQCFETDSTFECEHRIRTASGGYEWMLSRAVSLRQGAGTPSGWLGTSTSIEPQRKAEEALQALARELNHRVKNLFAIANGMVSMTARTAKDPKEMATSLRGRLTALSRAHEMVQPAQQAAEAQAGFSQIVHAVLEPYSHGGRDRIIVDGPSLRIGSNTTTSLALVLHELATNAAMYGALSSDTGELSIRWTIEDDTVDLRWTETGGPGIQGPPSAEGFGNQLSQRTIAGQLGGTLDREWRAEGLCVHMTLPVSRLAG
jgi:PAS domain S-box-containing protein